MNVPILFTPVYLTIDDFLSLGVFRADLKRWAGLFDGPRDVLWVILGSTCRVSATYGDILQTARGWKW